jgi:hypothetical protein
LKSDVQARLLAGAILLGGTLPAVPAAGGEADVVDVEIQSGSDGTWRFDVTVKHADEGWEHYADRWEVVAPNGNVLASRELAHPHVDEQPFTRSLAGIAIPTGVHRVTVRAHDRVHGHGGAERVVDVPAVAAPTGASPGDGTDRAPSPEAAP